MQLPGMRGALDDSLLREKAEQEAERLLEDLKKEVRAEIKDIGVLRKELHVTVPAGIIADHLDHNYNELRHDAIVPGFRKGRAPRRLVEKRFGAEVRESLTTSLIGQSFFAAVENHHLDVLGDPLFQVPAGEGVKLVDIGEAIEHLRLPDSGDFTYICEAEVKPEFQLPELTGIEIRAPEVAITDEMVEAELLRQRRVRGRFEPRPEAGAEKDDLLVADVTLTVDEKLVKHEDNVQLGVRPCAVDGIALPRLDEALQGARVGETRTVECAVPDDYERADVRGKSGRFQFTIHELKRLVPQPLPDFLQAAGFDGEKEAREFCRATMENERDELIERAKKEQICEYLLQQTPLELPEKLSARQTARAVLRRMIELRQRGMPESDIATRIDELQTSAQADVARELKLGFILDKVAAQLNIAVTDEEVNTEIARIARRYQRRFDRVRDDLQKQELLPQLAEQIRQDKCIARLLADAKLVEGQAPAGEKKKTTRKSRKK